MNTNESEQSRRWTWDNSTNCIAVESSGEKKLTNSEELPQLSTNSSDDSISLPQREPKIKFRAHVDQISQKKFRKTYMRVVKSSEINVVILQDVKDAVFFLLYSSVPKHFIHFAYTSEFDHFLISLILYFQYYFEIWDDVEYRMSFYTRKLKHPIGRERENLANFYLSKLRYIVATDYVRIIMGLGACGYFHHMANKEHKSMSEKDIILFEHITEFSTRVVWIALLRPNIAIIEKELNRLLRSDYFNVATKRGLFSGPMLTGTIGNENAILLGKLPVREKQYLVRSPLIHEVLGTKGEVDFQHTDHIPNAELMKRLELAYKIPEEYFQTEEICVGILGHPREVYEPLLQPKEKLTETVKRYSISSNFPGVFVEKILFSESSTSPSTVTKETDSMIDPQKVDTDNNTIESEDVEEQEVVKIIVRSKQFYLLEHKKRVRVVRQMWLQNRQPYRKRNSYFTMHKDMSEKIEYLKAVI